MLIVMSIFSFAVAIGLNIYGVKRSIEIKFSYSWDSWVNPILLSFAGVCCVFLLECILSNFLLNNFKFESIIGKFAKLFIANGLGILIFSVILSRIFEIMVEKLNLDYFEFYSDLIAKVCFSVLVLAVCFAFMYKLKDMEVNYEFWMNRVWMWLITVLGTWFGFGFGCKGRIERENKIRRNLFELNVKKNIIKFWIPIIWPLIVCILILFLICVCDEETIIVFEKYILYVTLIFVSVGLITLGVCRSVYNPSEDKSKNNFYKLINKSKKNKIVYKYFGRNRCHIENGFLNIDEISIIYPGHENDEDFVNLFGKIDDYEINTSNYDETLDFLKKRNENQNEYIKKAYESCIENLRKERLKK